MKRGGGILLQTALLREEVGLRGRDRALLGEKFLLLGILNFIERVILEIKLLFHFADVIVLINLSIFYFLR